MNESIRAGILLSSLVLTVPATTWSDNLRWEPSEIISAGSDVPEATGRFLEDANAQWAWNGNAIAVRDSSVFAVWVRRDGATDNDIVFRRYFDGDWDTPVNITANSTRDRSPAIAVDSSSAGGLIHILFESNRSVQDSTDVFEIYHVWSSDDGETWSSPPKAVSDLNDDAVGGTPARAMNPAVAVDEDGTVWASWWKIDSPISEGPGLGTLYYSRQTSGDVIAGDPWPAPQPLSISSYDAWTFDLGTGSSCAPCDSADCFSRASFATGPVGHDLLPSDGSVYFIFKDDSFRNDVHDLFPLISGDELDSENSQPWSNTCDVEADHVFFKRGDWNDTSQRLDWWGEEDLLFGSDVRVSPRQLEQCTDLDALKMGLDEAGCDIPGLASDIVPPSFLPSSRPMNLNFRPFNAIARTPNGMIHTFWREHTSYGSGGGLDIWCRRWGSSGFAKAEEFHPVSKNPAFAYSNQATLNVEATADQDGWLHVVYESTSGADTAFASAHGVDPQLFADNLALWQDANRKVH